MRRKERSTQRDTAADKLTPVHNCVGSRTDESTWGMMDKHVGLGIVKRRLRAAVAYILAGVLDSMRYAGLADKQAH